MEARTVSYRAETIPETGEKVILNYDLFTKTLHTKVYGKDGEVSAEDSCQVGYNPLPCNSSLYINHSEKMLDRT